MTHVYLVFQNDMLLGVYADGAKASARLATVLHREIWGGWVRSRHKDPDPDVQRWYQLEGRIARLSVEKEPVQ